MDNFDFKTLQIFIAVCHFHSFSKAGNALYLDQSTVSKKIRQLEDSTGLQLFNRTPQGVTLTPQAEELRPRVEKLLADFRQLHLPIKLTLADLRVGLMDNIAAYHYVDFLTKNVDQLKQVMISNKGVDLVDQFNEGELDALVLNADLAANITGEYREEVLGEEPFGLLSSQSLPKKEVSLANLVQKKFLIAPSYCPVSKELMQKLPCSASLQRVGYTNTLLEMVANSDYFTILPWQMTSSLVKNDQRFNQARITDLSARRISLFTRSQEVETLLVNWL